MSNDGTKQSSAPSGNKKVGRVVLDVTKLQKIKTIPPCPKWLTGNAPLHWVRIADFLIRANALNAATLDGLAVLAQLAEDVENCYRSGTTAPGALINNYRSMLNDFCMTPAAQQRALKDLPEKPPTPPSSGFDEF